MAIVAPHNLRRPDAGIQRPFGVRITLKAGDPFSKLLGADWNKTHWYGSAAERDAALAEMARKHEYSRARRQAGAEVRQGREAARIARPLTAASLLS